MPHHPWKHGHRQGSEQKTRIAFKPSVLHAWEGYTAKISGTEVTAQEYGCPVLFALPRIGALIE